MRGRFLSTFDGFAEAASSRFIVVNDWIRRQMHTEFTTEIQHSTRSVRVRSKEQGTEVLNSKRRYLQAEQYSRAGKQSVLVEHSREFAEQSL